MHGQIEGQGQRYHQVHVMIMPFDVKPHGVGVIGSGPFHQFVLERLSLRSDFAAIASWSDDDGVRSKSRLGDCAVHSSPQAVVDDPRTTVIYFASPTPPGLVELAIQSRKHVVLESGTAFQFQDLRHLARMAANQGIVAVLDEPRRWDEDFVCAKSVFDSGCLGKLERLRLAIHECSLPGEVFPQGVLRELGCHWLDQLLVFVDDEPLAVHLKKFYDSVNAGENGFLAVMDFAGGTSAVVEVQTDSLLSLRTGWLLEGTTGAYRAGRLYTKTADGEIVDEPVNRSSVSSDPFFDALAAAIDGDSKAQSALPGLDHAARVAELMVRLEISHKVE